jgi:hypothetical protein
MVLSQKAFSSSEKLEEKVGSQLSTRTHTHTQKQTFFNKKLPLLKRHLVIMILNLLLDDDTVWMWAVLPVFWRNLLPPSSRKMHVLFWKEPFLPYIQNHSILKIEAASSSETLARQPQCYHLHAKLSSASSSNCCNFKSSTFSPPTYPAYVSPALAWKASPSPLAK